MVIDPAVDSTASTVSETSSLLMDSGGSGSPAMMLDFNNSEDNDSYMAYSDDSASLSDAYFQPTDADMYPGLLLANSMNYHPPFHHPSYGSLPHQAPHENGFSPLYPLQYQQQQTQSSSPQMHHAQHHRGSNNSSPMPSTIHEDREEDMVAETLPLTSHHRILTKKQLKQLRQKKREQAARERAVKLVRGQPQPLNGKWNDVIWAIMFVLQLIVVLLCALRFGFHVILFDQDSGWRQYVRTPTGKFHWETRSLTDNSFAYDATPTDDVLVSAQPNSNIISGASQSFTIDYKNVIALVSITGFYACVMSYLSFGFMLILSKSLIQIMLIFSILASLSWGLLGLTMDPYGIISLMGFSALLLTLGYTMYNWNRIPFSSTNLYTALCAMRCTADITMLGLLSLLVAFGWCVIWTMAFVGIVNSYNRLDCDSKGSCHPHVQHQHIPIYILLLASFHWTNTVIKNVVRVTVASAIGTWWFQPSALSPCCTPAVLRPLWRSVTRSLGSICLGSFLIQPAQTLSLFFRCILCDSQLESPCLDDKTLQESGFVKDEPSSVDSAAETTGLCHRLAQGLQSILRFLRCCNRWSFTYIGMYNYSFTEAGEKAIQLFETREWLDVVKDNLIQNVLFMASVVIGGSAGIFAVVVEETDGYDFTSFHKPIISAFVLGSILGFVLSNILLLGVVGSAVNTVLVCFAAGPFEFDKNHPRLSREMRDIWSQQVWEPV